MLESFRDTKLEKATCLNELDLGVVTSEVQNIQATSYCGILALTFKHGRLQPICRLDQTKKII